MTDMTNQEQVFKFLDELQESGVTNMFGAGNYVQKEYRININEANNYVAEWMRTYDERHPYD